MKREDHTALWSGGMVPAAAVLVALAAFPLALHAGESELEEATMKVGDQYVTLVKYRGEHFNKVSVSALEKLQWKGRPVCVEGKFDQIVGSLDNMQVIQLIGSDIRFLYPTKLGMLGLIRGDNAWVGGVAESDLSMGILRVRIRGLVKLPNDMELFRQRYGTYTKKGEWRRLIDLGDRIGNAGKLAVGSLSDQDAYRRKQRQAYRKALEVWAAQIAQDDAEGHYAIAVKYLELLNDGISAQRYLKKCLQIDPAHRAAQEKLPRFGYVSFEGEWMTIAEMEHILKKRNESARAGLPEIDTPGTGAAQPQTGDNGGGETAFLSAEALASEKARIRQAALSAGRSEIDVLVEEAGRAKEAKLAVHIMHLLALKPEERSLDGISSLRALGQEDVLKASLEVLIWRPEKRAFDVFLAALESEKNAGVLSYGIELLAQAEPERSYPALIQLLESESSVLSREAQHQLRKLSGERFEKPSEWRSWWSSERSERRLRSGP